MRNRIAISGIAYDSNGAGSWSITQASVKPDGISGTAMLHYVGGRVCDAIKVTC